MFFLIRFSIIIETLLPFGPRFPRSPFSPCGPVSIKCDNLIQRD